jgi:hypothetical protein
MRVEKREFVQELCQLSSKFETTEGRDASYLRRKRAFCTAYISSLRLGQDRPILCRINGPIITSLFRHKSQTLIVEYCFPNK